MEKNALEQKCSSHGAIVVALDLHPLTSIKEKLLCINCLTDRIPQKKWIELIKDAEEKLKEAKLKEFNDKKKLIQARLEKLTSISQKLKDLQKQINSCINQANKMINEKIYEVEGVLKKLVQPTFSIFEEKDLLYLSNYQNSEQNINLDLDNQQEIEFVGQVKEQFQKILCENSIKELSRILEGLLYQNKNEEGKVALIDEKEDESHKTLALNYCCEKHNKEIIMININSAECESRLYCITCIVQNPAKLIDLKEANVLWQQLRQTGFSTQKTRVKKQHKIKDIMMNFQKKSNILQNELADLIYKQSIKIQDRIKFSDFDQDNSSLMELSLNQVKQVVNLLAQKDKQNLQLQEKIQLEDSAYQKELICKFSQMEENQNECTQFINQLFCLDFYNFDNINAIFSVKNLDLLKNCIQNSKSAQFEAQFFDFLIPYLLKQHKKYQQEIWQQIIEQIKIYLQQLRSGGNDDADQSETDDQHDKIEIKQLKSDNIDDSDQSQTGVQLDKVLKYQQILKSLEKQFYVQENHQMFHPKQIKNQPFALYALIKSILLKKSFFQQANQIGNYITTGNMILRQIIDIKEVFNFVQHKKMIIQIFKTQKLQSLIIDTVINILFMLILNLKVKKFTQFISKLIYYPVVLNQVSATVNLLYFHFVNSNVISNSLDFNIVFMIFQLLSSQLLIQRMEQSWSWILCS